MAEIEADKFLEAITQGRQYIPIRVNSLRLDTITNFDLYFQATPGEPEVLYADRALPFNEESRRRLESNNVQYLYVHSDQLPEYRRYIENNLSQILKDVSVPLGEKSQLLHITAQGVVRDVFEGPMVEEGLERGHAIVVNTVDFLFGQRDSLKHLIKSASLDYEIYTHSVNVCVMGVALAQRMGYSMDKLVDFGYGVMFRDIGMKKIDPAILSKVGSLSVAEFKKIQQHPIDSEAMLKGLNVDSDVVLSVVRHHHEKMDGSGYPDGLVGDEIPVLVRLCTVVDIFDALTTNRHNKKALSSFDALNVMSQEMRADIDMDMFKGLITMLGFAKK